MNDICLILVEDYNIILENILTQTNINILE